MIGPDLLEVLPAPANRLATPNGLVQEMEALARTNPDFRDGTIGKIGLSILLAERAPCAADVEGTDTVELAFSAMQHGEGCDDSLTDYTTLHVRASRTTHGVELPRHVAIDAYGEDMSEEDVRTETGRVSLRHSLTVSYDPTVGETGLHACESYCYLTDEEDEINWVENWACGCEAHDDGYGDQDEEDAAAAETTPAGEKGLAGFLEALGYETDPLEEAARREDEIVAAGFKVLDALKLAIARQFGTS